MTRHVLADVTPWVRGEMVALATVVTTFGSAPSPVGACMVIAADGEVWGSVSGGCVEGDVHARALKVLATGDLELVRYGISDDDAGRVGLTCGGTIEVLVEAVSLGGSPELAEFVRASEDGEPAATAIIVEHDEPHLIGRRLTVRGPMTLTADIPAWLAGAMFDDASSLLSAGHSETRAYGFGEQRRGAGIRVTFCTTDEPARMLVFGATDYGAAMTRIGKLLGFHVTLCDARETFATAARFPDADAVVVDWPHRYFDRQVELGKVDRRTVVCVLSHDPKFELPLLQLALTLPDAVRPHYVGAMGSRRTHERRMAELRSRGLDDAALDRLSSPMGLDLGGRSPDETAVSIAAEIIASRWGGTGLPLVDLTSSVHHDVGESPRAPRLHSLERGI